LAGAVQVLLDDPPYGEQLGAEAAARAEERWSRSRIIDKLAAELEMLAATGQGPITAGGGAGMQGEQG
jgi:glycosyltransferase involved in cell wall biosynthesis